VSETSGRTARSDTHGGARSDRDQPEGALGKPVIRGTRITVELILRKLGEGATPRDLLESYPHLTEDDVQAAIMYAADTLAHEETVLVEPKA
jgi:uncharacterized protein (DUF433 family)